MSKVIKSGKLDNVIASMDTGKHYIVKMRDGTVTAVEKIGLPEKIGMCLGNGCFIAGTLVTTKSGFKPIEEIVIGDYVLSRNEETGEDSYKKVTDTLVRSTQEICTIELENGNIKSTTGHLFMVKDKWWKAALELEIGDVLITLEGKEQVVKSIKVEEKGYPVTTYNLTVEDNHTFFVSDKGVLTHNMNNVLKRCNFATEVSEKLNKGVAEASKETVTYRRVQGGTPPNASWTRIIVDESGNIKIPNKKGNLNVSTGNDEHAKYFLSKRGSNAEIVEFNIPKWLDDFLHENAINQKGYKKNPLNQGGTAPKIVDPTTPGNSYELPAP